MKVNSRISKWRFVGTILEGPLDQHKYNENWNAGVTVYFAPFDILPPDLYSLWKLPT